MDSQNLFLSHGHLRDYKFKDYYPVQDVEVELANKDLWDKFQNVKMEMIITKPGRRMFPPINVRLSNLDPTADYCVFLEFALPQGCRFKFSSSRGWEATGDSDPQSFDHLCYMLPGSPSKGAHWMSQEVSFKGVKLTNTSSPPPNQVILSSMHRYQPTIVIVKSSNPDHLRLNLVPTKRIAFPETEFIAVTAYQDTNVTQLKIKTNPFAKGFRENGKANSKRKIRMVEGEEQEESDSSASDKSESPLPLRLSEPNIEHGRLYNKPPSTLQNSMNSHRPNVYGTPLERGDYQFRPCYSYYRTFNPYYLSSPLYFYPQVWTSPVPFNIRLPYKYEENQMTALTQEPKPKKIIKDFSIASIIGQ